MSIQSSDLKFSQFTKVDFETWQGAEAFCPNTVGAAPMIAFSEDDHCIFIIDRRGYNVIFVHDQHGEDVEEWFAPFTDESDAMAYWPTTPIQAEELGFTRRN